MTFVLLFRLVGYGLLLLTLFDVITAFIPPQFRNLLWQFQTAGGFVERSVVPLLGFILVFYGDYEARKKRERLLLKILSWISLLSAVFYFGLLMVFFIVPPIIYNNSEEASNTELLARIAQVQKLKTEVEKAQPAQIEALMKNNRVANTTDPQAFKAKLLQDAATAEKDLQNQAAIANNARKVTLIKNAVKWGLGALVVGVLFFRIWAVTSWAR